MNFALESKIRTFLPPAKESQKDRASWSYSVMIISNCAIMEGGGE